MPLSRDASSALPPFQARNAAGPQFGGDLINKQPGETVFGHGRMIGLSVQACQDAVSQDDWTPPLYRWRVNEEARFNDALCARVHRLRNERGWTAAQMATALGVPPERYRKYEYRSPLPHYLIERFSLIVGRDVEYVLTGKITRTLATLAENGRKLA